jgi:steroid delta-isomerase-like uncharacterized protein
MSQALIDAAKASIVAYNEKNWDAVPKVVTSDFEYDEVGTNRKLVGPSDVIAAWKGWATALPDSKATFNAAHVGGNTVTLEVTWRGTHTGPLETPAGAIPSTGKKIEVRACQVVELTPDGKTQRVRHYFDMATLLAQLGVSTVGA